MISLVNFQSYLALSPGKEFLLQPMQHYIIWDLFMVNILANKTENYGHHICLFSNIVPKVHISNEWA